MAIRFGGKSQKTVISDSGELEIEVPRDRNGSFEPQLVKKRQRRLAGCDDKVLYFYAQGLSTRDIQAQLEDICGVEVSPALISNITGAVMDEVRAWQPRPLAAVYPILYFDALMVKSRQEGPVNNRAVYLALGINLDGEKDLKAVYGAAPSPRLKTPWTVSLRDGTLSTRPSAQAGGPTGKGSPCSLITRPR